MSSYEREMAKADTCWDCDGFKCIDCPQGTPGIRKKEYRRFKLSSLNRLESQHGIKAAVDYLPNIPINHKMGG